MQAGGARPPHAPGIVREPRARSARSDGLDCRPGRREIASFIDQFRVPRGRNVPPATAALVSLSDANGDDHGQDRSGEDVEDRVGIPRLDSTETRQRRNICGKLAVRSDSRPPGTVRQAASNVPAGRLGPASRPPSQTDRHPRRLSLKRCRQVRALADCTTANRDQ